MRTLCSAIVLLAFVSLLPTTALAANEAKTAIVTNGSTNTDIRGPAVDIEDPVTTLPVTFDEPPQAIYFEAAGEAVETAAGACSGCSGWVFYKPTQCWRYTSGSEERIWMYFQGNSNYAYIDTGDVRHKQFLLACGNDHYIGLFWTSPNSFTNVRLWYY